jgi:hypothetical protein
MKEEVGVGSRSKFNSPKLLRAQGNPFDLSSGKKRLFMARCGAPNDEV